MGKKLAIKGHSTRGKEVIELLKMMGGEAIAAKGDDETAIYVIPVNGIIDVRYTYKKRINNYAIFTLEEFLEKYPFKVGDRVLIPEYESEVHICEMQWDGFEIQYKVYRNEDSEWYTTEELLNYNDDFFEDKHCNKNQANEMKNVLTELLEHIKTTPKEELEREFNELEEWSHVGPTVEEFMDFCNKVNKKLEYPKTYEECAEKINACPIVSISYDSDEDMLYNDEADLTLLTLRKLLICRDAYWKIAGEQMGLGKPWEPDWKDDNDKYFICYIKDELWMSNIRNCNRLLVFPTEEMRDVFCENFMDLIEQCKELL